MAEAKKSETKATVKPEAVKETVQETVKTAGGKAVVKEPAAKKAPAKKAPAKRTTAKKTAAKAETVKTEAAKAEPVKAAAPEKKAPGRKPAAKKAAAKAEVKEAVTVQFSGKSYSTEDLVKIARDVWQYDLGKDLADFKSVELYVKPEESSVYYVVNGEVTGSFAI